MNKAVFLDRDGVLNREREDYTFRVDDFEILQDVEVNLRKLQDAGFIFIVITNQGGIARKFYTRENVEDVHRFLEKEIDKSGLRFHEIYYCPHHPETGNCICRKPDSLLIEKAMARFSIEQKKSYFIGDKNRDILAAEKAGLTAFQIEQNTSLNAVTKKILERESMNL